LHFDSFIKILKGGPIAMTEETRKKHHEEKPLDKMTVKELREVAAELPHERAIHDMKKEEIITFIKEARGIKDEVPVKKKKQTARIKMTKGELKAKIREIKGLRWQAIEDRDGGKAVAMRQQLSKLKKISRRLAAV
jgi:tRNA U34 2-thiouridine synthase MnmA/TrmU